MKIVIRELDIQNNQHIDSIVKWENDEELYELIIPKKENTPREIIDFDKLKARYLEDPKHASGIYLIFDNDTPIGNFSIQINPPHLMKKVDGTSWLGLTIGERKYWGTRAAKVAMEFYEKESRRLGANRVELGTFEYNYRAQAFYKKLGYQEIGRLNKFTYWNGKFWDDIRMEKKL